MMKKLLLLLFSICYFSLIAQNTKKDSLYTGALNLHIPIKTSPYRIQTLDTKTVGTIKESNFLNTLSGKIAGMQVLTSSGNLSSSTRILIRGVRDIYGDNQPLFVIDGIPLYNTSLNTMGSNPTVNGYDYGDVLQDINAEDIASFEVLKGGAACALYGERGKNGVIMIETKKGEANRKVNVTFVSQLLVEQVAVLPNYQNEYGGGLAFDTAWVNPNNHSEGYQLIANKMMHRSWGPKFNKDVQVRTYESFYPQIEELYGKTTPWVAQPNNVKSFFQTGVAYNNALAISGGSKKYLYRINYTNLVQTGVLPNSKLARNTITTNLTYKPIKNLAIDLAGTYTHNQAQGRAATGENTSNPMFLFNNGHPRQMNMSTLKKYYAIHDSLQLATPFVTLSYLNNPYWAVFKNYETDNMQHLWGKAALTYHFTSYLNLRVRYLAHTYLNQQAEIISRELQTYSSSANTTNKQTYLEQNVESLLCFDKNMLPKWRLNAFVGVNHLKSDNEKFYKKIIESNISTSESIFHLKTNSFLGGIGMNYHNTFTFYITQRYDKDVNSPFKYPYSSSAISAAFVLSELPAFQKQKVISFAKVYANANYTTFNKSLILVPASNAYIYINPITGTQTIDSISTNAILMSAYSPKTAAYEIGIDISFLQNRIGIHTNLYTHVRADREILGFIGTQPNILDYNVQNKGIEASLYVIPIQKQHFSWLISANFSKNIGTIMIKDTNYHLNYDRVNNDLYFSTTNKDKNLYGTIFGTDYFYDKEGNKLLDKNGYYLMNPNNQAIGNIMPKWIGSITNTITYRRFSLAFLIDIKKGGDIYSRTFVSGLRSGILQETVNDNIRENGIVQTGIIVEHYGNGEPLYDTNGNLVVLGENNIPVDARMAFLNGINFTKSGIFDGSYVKLREAQIAYNIPFVNKRFIREIIFSIMGRNLWVIHKNVPHIDPENVVSSGNLQGIEMFQLPSTRSIGCRASFSF